MHRIMVRTWCFLALLLTASFALAQAEFSADVVETQKGEKGPTKVYFGKNKMRFDSGENGGRTGTVIMDFATQSFVIVMDQQHMYMEVPSQAMEKRGMFNFFRTGDAEDTCAEWLKLERNKGGTCHKVGSDTVNDRKTEKYEGTNSDGEASTIWLDPKLRFPVKWQSKTSGGELRNIQEGAQPASLFEVPSGYTKMDMGGMTKRPQ
jgi:Domain of unknown function (DUF4412)